ncbi:acetylcholine receptor subunit beta-type unc-29-like [Symsagittifera roscoffensis]|uniref:acetylcholine receptor subunit beta-type unc-29-like n=1 Tax=Symsagittifera roscoffensis TaxID=84072 RepID=UPI00307B4ADE
MLLLWRDEFLSWNSSNYGGLQEISVNPARMWMPDILVANRQDDEPLIQKTNQILAAVSYKGHVSYLRPMVVTVQCDMDTRHFPWDRQQCNLIVASWTNFEDDVKLEKQKGPDDDLIRRSEHHEWTLEPQTPIFRSLEVYDYVEQQWRKKSFIQHQINFHRKPGFYVIVIVIPTVVISVICMFVFLIPNGSTEKIAYSMSMMLTLYVNLLTVANRIPNNSNKYPYIGVYYLVCIFLIATSLLQSTLALTMHFKSVESTRAPMWLRKRVQCVAFVAARVAFVKHLMPLDLVYFMDAQDVFKPLHPKWELKREEDANRNKLNSLEKSIKRTFLQFDSLRYGLDKSCYKKRKHIQVVAEWQLIAKLIDFVLGIFYITATLFINAFIILKVSRCL